METKQIKITNRKQFDCLVATMEKYPPVAKGLKFSEAANFNRKKFEGVWSTLTKDLNSLGPPIQSLNGWQKVWNDYKLKTKKKLSHNLTEARATGGGPNKMTNLTSCEEAVVALLQLDKTVASDGNTYGLASSVRTEVNFQEPSCSGTSHSQKRSEHQEKPNSEDSEDENLDPNNGAELPSTILHPQQSVSRKREELLEEQTKCIQEIRDGVKDLARYTRKNIICRKKKFASNKKMLYE